MRTFLLFFALLVQFTSAYRYLMVSVNIGYSHLAFDGQLADILVKAGHEVDFMVFKWNTFVQGNGSRLANVTHYTPKSLEKLNRLIMTIPFYTDVFHNEVDLFERSNLKILSTLSEHSCYDLLADTEFLESLKKKNYDGAFAEIMDSCSPVFFRLIGIKNVMQTSPTALSETTIDALGLPALPSFVPVLNHAPVRPLEMSFLERLTNFYYMFRSLYIVTPAFYDVFDKPGKLSGKVIPTDFPLSSEILQDVTAIFVNTNEYTDLPKPTVTKVHQIGGIALKEPKKLDEKTSQIFDTASKGVVLFSFGSIVDTTKMDTRIRNAFLEAFAQFPEYEFIWKFDGAEDQQAEVFQNYTNVHLSEWVDQTSILSHPKTRAFISHVGLNSLNEAAYFGVPILAIPFFGDQTYNTAVVDHLKIGIPLSKRQLDTKILSSALQKVLTDDSLYLKRSRTVSRMLKAQRVKPAENFVHQVEFATQFTEELKQRRLPDMSLFFYYSLDVISFLAFILVAAIFSVYFVLKRVQVLSGVALKLKKL